jgi:hypothetical protein
VLVVEHPSAAKRLVDRIDDFLACHRIPTLDLSSPCELWALLKLRPHQARRIVVYAHRYLERHGL